MFQAEQALSHGEVPVGCIIVYDKKIIIGKGRNETNETKNATRHAELIALEETKKWCKERKLEEKDIFKSSTLYVTVEPCIMCTAALRYMSLKRVVFGCNNERFGGCGSILTCHTDKYLSTDKSFEQDLIPGESLQYSSGIGSETAIRLLKQFYQGENPNAPNPIDKSKRS